MPARPAQASGDVGRAHRGAELPGDDVAGEVVEHGQEVEPAPAGDLEVGEVRLPELIDGCGVRMISSFSDAAYLIRRPPHPRSRLWNGPPLLPGASCGPGPLER